MGDCNATNTSQNGLLSDCDPTFIGCVPVTNGEPIVIPEVDQLPIHIDPDTGCIWLYVCDEIGWFSVCPGSQLCDLTPVDVSVLVDVCEELNIPVSYTFNGECVEGVVTLQNLADEIANCLPDNSADCCFEPVVEEARAGEFLRSRCFRISSGNNDGTRLIDSLNSEFEGAAGEPLLMDWSYTNTTNQPGLLSINATMWAERFQPSSGIRALALFMLGQEDAVKSYPLNTPNAPGDGSDTPFTNPDMSYDTRELVATPIYPFWGNWNSTLCPTCDPSMPAAADVSHEFLLQPGETIDLSGRVAIGYETAVDTAGTQLESGWIGVNIRYAFQGANDIST